MNSKERVIAAVQLEQPDRVPISAERLSQPFQTTLREHFALEPGQDLIEALHKLCGVDVVLCEPDYEGSKLGNGAYRDEWGVVYRSPKETGEPYIVDHPLKTYEDIEDYLPPEPLLPERFTTISKAIARYGESLAILGGVESVFEKAYNLRGLGNLIVDLYRNPRAAMELFEKITRHRVEQAEIIVDMGIDIFYTGSDYGTQTGPMMNSGLWRRFVMPFEKRIFDIPRNKGIPIFVHSCGDIRPLLGSLVEIGMNIVNPVQPRAMDPVYVKEKFSDRLCLFGTIDVQHTLPFGTPNDVMHEVRERIETLAHGGGLILAPAHTVLPQVPIENFLAFTKAATTFGRYPLNSARTCT